MLDHARLQRVNLICLDAERLVFLAPTVREEACG
jgi:hypothetical protein